MLILIEYGFWSAEFPTNVGKILSDSGAFKKCSLHGEENSLSGRFNPVGRLQQSGCLPVS